MDTTVASLVTLALVICFIVIVRKALRPAGADVDFGQWLDDFSVERYRPMERLLTPEDDEFLRSQPGHSPALSARLRSERRRLFRRYLRSLRRDFARLHRVARLIVLYSPVDRPDLAEALWRIRVSFLMAVVAVEWRLMLHVVGARGVDVRTLLDTVKGLELRVRMQPASA